MPMIHTVLQGEDMFTIAAQHGFRDYRTIYDDPLNVTLRKQRPNPGMLHPLDQVAIPDMETRVEERPTGERHTFHTLGMRRWLRLRILGPFGKPLSEQPYTLELDGKPFSQGKSTDDKGELFEAIPARARTGKISVGDLFWELDIGELNPVIDAPDGGISGAQARLANLGYDPGPIDGSMGPRTASAVRRFQQDHLRVVNGALDDTTRAKLVELHGC